MIFCRFSVGSSPHWGQIANNIVSEIAPDPYGSFEPTGLRWPLKSVTLLPPSEPSKIICIGVNYADHAKEFGRIPPSEPLFFLKPPSALLPPGGLIRLPSISHQVEYEGELAFVIKRRAKNVNRRRAKGYILGYTILNDITARDLQRKDSQWTRAKGFDTFAPLGPFVVSHISPRDLKIETFVNGKVKQSSRTSRLIFKVPDLLEHVSRVMTLEPGDVISTGTPAGVGPLKRGDRVAVLIEKIGKLENVVR